MLRLKTKNKKPPFRKKVNTLKIPVQGYIFIYINIVIYGIQIYYPVILQKEMVSGNPR